jgi:NADPH2:quinone reductase
VINYKAGGIDEALEKFGPIDVWWEILREPDLERAVARLAPRGRIILMAGREARPVFPVGPFYLKDASVHGMAMFNAPAEEQRKCAAEINRWLAKGKLRALIGRVMKLSETAAAHRLQEESTLQKKGGLMGKIVLEP